VLLGGKFNGNPYDALSLCYCCLRSQHEEALKDGILWYEEMLGNVESYQLYAGYANILANCKKYRQALKAYNKAIELKPTLINAHVSIAFIHEYGKKDHEKSEEIAKKLISLYPDNMYAQLILAKSEKDITSQIDKLKEIGVKHPEYVRINF
jgi:tetratricopeptide (TPR) repeat protein